MLAEMEEYEGAEAPLYEGGVAVNPAALKNAG